MDCDNESGLEETTIAGERTRSMMMAIPAIMELGAFRSRRSELRNEAGRVRMGEDLQSGVIRRPKTIPFSFPPLMKKERSSVHNRQHQREIGDRSLQANTNLPRRSAGPNVCSIRRQQSLFG
jgi:hypothetical protein